MVTTGEPILVTVVGGYLGSGKTTLVNNLLRAATSPIAVIVNDFGSINIDAELIESDDGTTIALSNGCICCSLVDGFGTALQTVRGGQRPPARLVIEASGVADPQQVAAYAHTPGFLLDGVIVLVDGANVLDQLASELIGDVVADQIGVADLVILNKVDLLSRDEERRVQRTIHPLTSAPTVRAVDGLVPEELLFGIEPLAHDETGPHDLSEAFDSWTETADVVDRSALEERLADLPEAVVRVKGFVRFGDSPHMRHLVQVVGRRVSVSPWGPFDGEPSNLVFIERRAA